MAFRDWLLPLFIEKEFYKTSCQQQNNGLLTPGNSNSISISLPIPSTNKEKEKCRVGIF